MNAKQKLTVKEALEQGYSKCTNVIDHWCHLTDITDLTDVDFENDTWWLAEKESRCYQISDDCLSDLLSDHIGCNEHDETGRDDEEVYNAIGSLDYSETTKMINEKLQEFKYYRLSSIELIR